MQQNQKTTTGPTYHIIAPTNNMHLQRKWDKTRFDSHRSKVYNAKSLIDNKSPMIHMHCRVNLKKLQMEEERKANIERDNRILVERLAQVMSSKGKVDHINNYQQRSLNTAKRQRDLIRVTLENHAFLKRIQSREPHYNHRQWLREWYANRSYGANIAKYSHSWNQQQQQQHALQTRNTAAKAVSRNASSFSKNK